MTNNKYPKTLSNAIRDFVENEGFNINDTLESFQFLYSEAKLSQMITWKMRQNVLDLLVNNGAKRSVTSRIERHSFVKITKGPRKGLVAKVLFLSDNNEKAFVSFIDVGAGSGWAKINNLEPYER